jgi:hypothetical protein
MVFDREFVDREDWGIVVVRQHNFWFLKRVFIEDGEIWIIGKQLDILLRGVGDSLGPWWWRAMASWWPSSGLRGGSGRVFRWLGC